MTIDSVGYAAATLTPLAAAHRLHLSSSSAILLGAAAGALFVVASQLLCKSRRSARLCYWIGAITTTVLLAVGLGLAGRPLRVVLIAIAACVCLPVGFAYFGGWQLRIGGQTRSVFVKNTYPDPPDDGSDPLPPPPPPANDRAH